MSKQRSSRPLLLLVASTILTLPMIPLQNAYSQTTFNTVQSQPNNTQTAQPVYNQTMPQMLPGNPWAAQQGNGHWVPGRFELQNGMRVWMRGHYETNNPTSGNTSTVPTTPFGMPANQQATVPNAQFPPFSPMAAPNQQNFQPNSANTGNVQNTNPQTINTQQPVMNNVAMPFGQPAMMQNSQLQATTPAQTVPYQQNAPQAEPVNYQQNTTYPVNNNQSGAIPVNYNTSGQQPVFNPNYNSGAVTSIPVESLPAPDQAFAPVHDTLKGFVRPFPANQNNINNADNVQQDSGQQAPPGGGQWLPGHFETVNGAASWVRGHYASKTGTVVGPPKEWVDSALAEKAAKEQLINKAQPQGWAVVIGISSYKNEAGQIPELRYAATDAEKFYNFLRTPEGGGFAAERIVLLTNENATLKNIKHAFFDFLKKALEEDFVVVFFSGHGVPELENEKNLYLLTYDSDPDQLASTAFPMWDVETAFSRFIRSDKVVMFADACHSGGIAGDIAMRSLNDKNMIGKYLLEVARAKKGRAIFTASEAGELSQESKRWGDGQGVFTHFLINGLKGAADVNNDHLITLGELIDYVSENVRRSTNNTQHPDVAGNFDRGFPLAVTQK